MDALEVQVEPDNLRSCLPKGIEVIVIASGPAIAGIAVGEQAAVNYAIFNGLLRFYLQDPQLQRAVTGVL